VHVKLDENTVQILFNKSGVASKKGLDVLACVIDEDYQGEIHINLVNTTNNIVMIRECEKIVQAIEFDTYYSELDECTLEALYPHKTERADGGFGSTNKV
jgi:dUTP pyrophosphatase